MGSIHRFIVFLITASLFGCKASKVVAPSALEVNSVETEKLSEDSLKPIIEDTISQVEEPVELQLYPTPTDYVDLVAVGDIMMGTNFPNESYLPRDKGRMLWKDVKSYLQEADICFGNLEGVILSDGGEQKECKNPKACYLFRTPDEYAFNFKEAGFDLLSLANNHANDFGQTGRLNTQKVLDSLGIAYAGSIESPVTSITRKRLRIGLIAVAPNKGTLSIHDTDQILRLVKELDKKNDIVLVSFHAGAEGAKNMHVTREREFYYGEDRGNVYDFAHLMIDQGADLLIGHGPHVPRAIELYQDRLIVYSLGNFLTYGRFNLKGPNGEAPLFRIRLDNAGRFMEGQIHSFYQDYQLGPRLDMNAKATHTIRSLSIEDFPESPIIIDETGRISYIPN